MLGCIASATCYWVYRTTLSIEISEIEAAGKARLNEATNRLKLQLGRYKAQANLIARSSGLFPIPEGPIDDSLREELVRFALTYGVSKIDLFDANGALLASSSRTIEYDNALPLVKTALNGSLGYRHAVRDDNRFIQLSRSVKGMAPADRSVLVMTINLSDLEFEWPITPEPVMFLNQMGDVISSNRPGLLLQNLGSSGVQESTLQRSDAKTLNLQTWIYAPANGSEIEVIRLSQNIPQLNLTGEILLDVEPAVSVARLRLMLTLAVLTMISLIAAIAWQQRRRWALEARHSATLEARVQNRTRELHLAQEKLVEASNLAALGRLSAGVSHELNQPLAAILNFAENGQEFLSRGANEKVSGNLRSIAEQIKRITRIIANLRAFARQESMPTEKVDLIEIVKSSINATQASIHQTGTTLKLELPDEPVFVQAGKIRLEQVISNLISNALDAMLGSREKVLTVILDTDFTSSKLRVADTGTGITNPERVFEPFYTTKDLGSSKGLGMGLALSFGIISHFGGSLSCRNLSQGAEFKIILPLETS